MLFPFVRNYALLCCYGKTTTRQSASQRRKYFPNAFSIVGQCHFYCSHKPIIRLLVGEDEYKRLDVDALAEHITQFTLRALGATER